MTMGLTQKQADCLSLIKSALDIEGVVPSFSEIRDHLGLSAKSGVHRLIKGLEERGAIRCRRNDKGRMLARAIEIIEPNSPADVSAGESPAGDQPAPPDALRRPGSSQHRGT